MGPDDVTDVVEDQETHTNDYHAKLGLREHAAVFLEGIDLPLQRLREGEEAMELELCLILDELWHLIRLLLVEVEPPRRQEAICGHTIRVNGR